MFQKSESKEAEYVCVRERWWGVGGGGYKSGKWTERA